MKLSDFKPNIITKLLGELKEEATSFVRNCDADAEIFCEFKVYMRYQGQGWEIPIVLTEEQATKPDADTFQNLFETDYAKLFGRPVAGLDVEITVWSVNATTPPDSVTRIKEQTVTSAADINACRTIFDPALGKSVEASIVLREKLSDGQTIVGPAAITEDETTIIVPSSRIAVRQSDGCVDMNVKEVNQ